MRGNQVMLWALFFISLCGCHARQGTAELAQLKGQKGASMISLQGIIDSLGANDATTASVAAAVGTLGQRDASEYVLHPRDPALGEGRLGVSADETQKAPTYVQFYLPTGGHLRLRDVQPACSSWAKVPGNPAASPFRYGCHLPAKAGGSPVNLLVTLSDSSDSSHAEVEELLLQRSE